MSGVNISVLAALAAAQASNQPFYVSAEEGMPLVQHVPPLIVVDGSQRDPSDANKVSAKLTEDGARMASGNSAPAATVTASHFSVASGFVAPKVKRFGAGGGNPGKYPFETLEKNQIFFVADSDVKSKDAFKTLSSAVGSANDRFSEDIMENGAAKTKVVERTKRGPDHKAVKGPDGKNIRETVTVNEKRSTRKFVARKVEKGVTYGTYVAPDNGAVALRTE